MVFGIMVSLIVKTRPKGQVIVLSIKSGSELLVKSRSPLKVTYSITAQYRHFPMQNQLKIECTKLGIKSSVISLKMIQLFLYLFQPASQYALGTEKWFGPLHDPFQI